MRDDKAELYKKALEGFSVQDRVPLRGVTTDASLPVVIYSTPDGQSLSMSEPAPARVTRESEAPAGDDKADIITGDAGKEIDQILADIRSKYKDLTDAQIAEIRTLLTAMIRKGTNNVGELMAAAEKEASGYSGDISQNLSPQQRELNALWKDVHEREKDVAEKMQEALDRGDITKEQYDAWLKKYRQAQALDDDDPRKMALTKEAALMAEKDLNQAADSTDDVNHAQDYHKGAGNAHKIQEDLDQAYKVITNPRVDVKETVLENKRDNQKIDDDDEPAIAGQPAATTKLTVTDVTHEDVQTPSGGKDRTANRAITKAT